MDELPIRTITHVVDRIASIGASLLTLSGRMQQCPYMGEAPSFELFEQAEREAERLEDALTAYDRMTAPQADVDIKPVDEHQLDIEDVIASFEGYKAKMGIV